MARDGHKIYLFGNYADGAGNDAMVFGNRYPWMPPTTPAAGRSGATT